MHYEVYIDILFFTNFMMDTLLLFAVRKFLKRKETWFRIVISGAIGAGMTCVIYVLPVQMGMKIWICIIGIPIVMLKIGFKLQDIQETGKAFLILFGATVGLGGVLQLFRPYIPNGIGFFCVMIISYGMLRVGWMWMMKIRRAYRRTCEVTVHRGEKTWTIQALIDTGNCLMDPILKEPVHVIDKETAKLFGFENTKTIGTVEEDSYIPFHYIPYRTVAGTGVMPVFRVEKILVKAGQDEWIENPILGVSEEKLSENGMYHMILNTAIFDMRGKDGKFVE